MNCFVLGSALYILIGLFICALLSRESLPGHWKNYILMTLGWPVIFFLAIIGKL